MEKILVYNASTVSHSTPVPARFFKLKSKYCMFYKIIKFIKMDNLVVLIVLSETQNSELES